MTDSSLIAKLTHSTAYRYVSDAFGRDPAAYDSVEPMRGEWRS